MDPVVEHYLRNGKGIRGTARHFGVSRCVVGAKVARYLKCINRM